MQALMKKNPVFQNQFTKPYYPFVPDVYAHVLSGND
jgi:hypothetical protein